MIFTNTKTTGLENAIRSIRDNNRSWNDSDSGFCKGGSNSIGCENCAVKTKCNHYYDNEFKIGKTDLQLAHDLLNKNNDNFMKMIHVQSITDKKTIDTDYAKLRNFYLQWLKNENDKDGDYEIIGLIVTLPYAKELIMFR